MNIRISGGQFKGFKFNNPKSSDLRPTMESVRLAIFSILDSKFDGITNETVFLDLYSGTGIMGTESLSRGADKAIFIEKNRSYCYKIKENLKKLNLLNRAEILPGSVFANLSKINNKVTHIFLAPPYIFKDYKNGKLKVISFYAKRARGEMCNYIIKNKIVSIDKIKKFNNLNYIFTDENSGNLVFTRYHD